MLVLKIENAAQPQVRPEYRHERGKLTIGRGDDADWQIDDPDMYVSRRHCVISGEDGDYTVTDASRGGLFLDGSERALGAGNSAPLEHGTRMRLGDFVIRVEIENAAARTEAPRRPEPVRTTAGTGFDDDEFFEATTREPERQERPANLPDPFEKPRGRDFFGSQPADEEADDPPPPQFDDPFTLDPVRSDPVRDGAESGGQTAEDDPSDLPGFDWTEEPDRSRQRAAPRKPEAAPHPEPPPESTTSQAEPARPAPEDAALRAAFYRGMGIPPAAADDPAAEMEALGKRFRMMTEGLQHLLRARARERDDARVSRTIIGAQDVNPLKFVVTTEEALAALVAARGPGYLDPDTAIHASIRDLAEHNVKSWTGLQAALRRMIDRFDPKEIEAEMEQTGALGALFSGGRSAKLWQLYKDRYNRIARAAEERFLGEVGEDFRDAYEGRKQRGTRDD